MNDCCDKCSGRLEDENGFGTNYGCLNDDCECHPLKALDIRLPADTVIPSVGTAYYRLPDHLLDFLKLCKEKHGILGFEWDGTRNFGVILKNPAK